MARFIDPRGRMDVGVDQRVCAIIVCLSKSVVSPLTRFGTSNLISMEKYSLSMQSIKHQILSNTCRTIPTSRNFTLLSRLPLKLRPTSHLSLSLPTPSKSPVPPVLTLLGPPESVRNVNLRQSRSLAKRTE